MAAGKILVWRTVKRSLLFPLEQFVPVVTLLAAPLGLLVGLALVLNILCLVVLKINNAPAVLLSGLAGFLAYTAFIVQIHRFILLQEPAKLLWLRDMFRARVLKFVGAGLALILLMALFMGLLVSLGAIIGAGINGKQGAAAALPLTLVLAFPAALYFNSLFFLLFPNIAVGSPLRLREVIRLSKGNRLRLLAVICISQLPCGLLNLPISPLLQRGGPAMFTGLVLLILVSTYSVLVYACALSDMFRELLILEKARRDSAAAATPATV